jgi:hypothetical protein
MDKTGLHEGVLASCELSWIKFRVALSVVCFTKRSRLPPADDVMRDVKFACYQS